MNVEVFKNLAMNNQLSHGYIFWGPDQGTIFVQAQELAHSLENNARMLSDTKIIESENRSVGIDQIREITSFLWQKPLFSPRKILIIKNADQLTPQAQNALLKITEEPPAHGLIILMVNRLEDLLPTLLSRLQKIYFFGKIITEKHYDLLAKDFLGVPNYEKKNIIKNLLAEEGDLGAFVKSVIVELDHDPVKNIKPLSSLLTYWTNINKYNTNKKLQMEAWIESF